jgi:hypothetical protein
MSLRRKRTVIPVTVMVAGGIDILVGTEVVIAAEADQGSIDGGDLSVLHHLATSYCQWCSARYQRHMARRLLYDELVTSQSYSGFPPVSDTAMT